MSGGGTSRSILEYVRDGVGLGRAIDLLDASGGGEGQSHRDDLDALLQVADLHPDPAGLEPWLRSVLTRPGDEAGVTLSTIHRVKGREWARVAVFGTSDGLMPHRLAQGRAAQEEERRVFHVAITRGVDRVTVLADATRPSPFLSELDHEVTPEELAEAEARMRATAEADDAWAAEATGQPRAGTAAGRGRGPGPRGPRAPVPEASSPAVAQVEASLRAWRKERSRADGVAAFIVLSDRHLMGIAERRPASTRELAACPGIGPAKLAAYGDELIEVVASAQTVTDGGGE
jgi:DNA helicase-2/ATP-dependent DNA helicase PcrA